MARESDPPSRDFIGYADALPRARWLHSAMEVYPGDPGPRIELVECFADTGWNMRRGAIFHYPSAWLKRSSKKCLLQERTPVRVLS